MLRIGILDDEEEARQALRYTLYQLYHKEENDLIILDFTSGEELLSWLHRREGEMDLCFLDIEMDGINGMETARKIRSFRQDLALIFVTGYQDYVFEGYTVGACGYLLKPFTKKQLKDAVNLALARLIQKEPETFTIQNKEGLYRLPISSILYFYSSGRKIYAVTEERTYDYYGKMKEAEEKAGDGFVRIHQRYLVQAKKVEAILGESVTVGDTSLPISRNYQKSAMAAFMKAML